jgi:hypothetical protein
MHHVSFIEGKSGNVEAGRRRILFRNPQSAMKIVLLSE